VADDVWLTW